MEDLNIFLKCINDTFSVKFNAVQVEMLSLILVIGFVPFKYSVSFMFVVDQGIN